MNLSKYIGKTFRHPKQGRFTCSALIYRNGVLQIAGKGCELWVRASECKRIVKKQQRLEWWIYERLMRAVEYSPVAMKWDGWFDNPHGAYIRTTRPENTDGWICVKEVRKK